jgi:hypothetical protein
MPGATNSTVLLGGFRPIHQSQNVTFLGIVREGMEISYLVQPPRTVEGIQKMGIGRGQFARFKIARSEIFVLESILRAGFKQVKPEPAPVRSRDPLRFSEKRDEKQQDQVGVHHALQLQIPRKVLAIDPSQAGLKLQRGVQRVVNFLHEHNQRPDIAV